MAFYSSVMGNKHNGKHRWSTSYMEICGGKKAVHCCQDPEGLAASFQESVFFFRLTSLLERAALEPSPLKCFFFSAFMKPTRLFSEFDSVLNFVLQFLKSFFFKPKKETTFPYFFSACLKCSPFFFSLSGASEPNCLLKMMEGSIDDVTFCSPLSVVLQPSWLLLLLIVKGQREEFPYYV